MNIVEFHVPTHWLLFKYSLNTKTLVLAYCFFVFHLGIKVWIPSCWYSWGSSYLKGPRRPLQSRIIQASKLGLSVVLLKPQRMCGPGKKNGVQQEDRLLLLSTPTHPVCLSTWSEHAWLSSQKHSHFLDYCWWGPRYVLLWPVWL